MMRIHYRALVEFLKENDNIRKIVLVTVPPVAKLERSEIHWSVLQQFNNFILEIKESKWNSFVLNKTPRFNLILF